ncbi:fluoride efflux transporter CrcB [Agrobacterium tumefaciens]|uniref:fluoride efflux transporter CrcB n=1 Tax=Agrobacterium tumefaciens TaxID=358 RepID=UPI00287C40DF|nr:fluoride efflux transporter CrcB [Agrobacterium tumefaciens]MDS7596963.1 fluoride efflux transporter CrcB [Agrobacterium tumefaciens]
MLNLALVATGGAIGSVLRYLVGVWSVRIAGTTFPWGTLVVNVVGSFLIGFLFEFIARRMNASMEMRLFIVTGVLGGFTTFSSFSLDAAALFERGAFSLSAVYVIATLVVSMVAVFAGLALGRSLL